MSKRELKVSVRITRVYGDMQAEFGLEEIVQVSSGEERRDAFDNLREQLIDQIAYFEQHGFYKLPLPHATLSGTTRGGSPTDKDTFTVKWISVSVVNGVRRYKIGGGRWVKFGVPLYPDCPGLNWDLESYPVGRHDLTDLGGTPLIATAELHSGKPKRILELKPAT